MQSFVTANPVVGADQSVGLSPDSMHSDPTTGVPYYDQAVAAQMAAQAAANPAPSVSPLLLLLVVGGLAWWGYQSNWWGLGEKLKDWGVM